VENNLKDLDFHKMTIGGTLRLGLAPGYGVKPYRTSLESLLPKFLPPFFGFGSELDR
jgi:hypothetical protein